MSPSKGVSIAAGVALLVCAEPAGVEASVQQPPVAIFRAGVDLMRVSAVVRDRSGRFVGNLTARDFEILDRGVKRPSSDFRQGQSGVSRVVCVRGASAEPGRRPHIFSGRTNDG